MSILNVANTTHAEGSEDGSDDFVILDESTTLAIRPKEPQVDSTPRLELNSYKTGNRFLVSVRPPTKPAGNIKHVPCDIVLVIDVSGSMAELAPLPDVEDEKERETSGLTVLDLVKHACKTIISTLNEGDRLALVTFSRDAEVVQSLTEMTITAKADVLDKVEKLKDDNATNLWAGIRAGLQQFEQYPPIGNTQGLYILTDGQPNYMCPQQGYIPKLKPLLHNLSEGNGSAPTLHTFGFGYAIRSDLMLSIAKAGNGNYSFIPEVGMIGTVFVHAVANLYATFATNAILEVENTDSSAVYVDHNSGLSVSQRGPGRLLIRLGSIQYGQSRDLLISHSPSRNQAKKPIRAKLTYIPHAKPQEIISTVFFPGEAQTVEDAVLEYHLHRHDLCKFLGSLYPIDPVKDEHATAPDRDVKSAMSSFEAVVAKLTSSTDYASNPNFTSLTSDLVGPQLNPQTPEHGQIYQALQTELQKSKGGTSKSYWQKWGRHYLSSLWCAHMRQMCNSFKDAGPLRYGTDSELFKNCRDELDAAFDGLPPPVGTYRSGGQGRGGGGSGGRRLGHVSMQRYNRADNVCFLGSCSVMLAEGRKVKVEDLRAGMMVHSPLTDASRKVVGIVKAVGGPGEEICRVGTDLWITPWHPILDTRIGKWVFPRHVAEETSTLRDQEAVYSVLLEHSNDKDAHAIEVGAITCVTLGHGVVTDANGDVRAHPFFGNHRRVQQSLAGLSVDEYGRWLCGGLIRDAQTGLSCGVLGVSSQVDCNHEVKGTDMAFDGGDETLAARL